MKISAWLACFFVISQVISQSFAAVLPPGQAPGNPAGDSEAGWPRQFSSDQTEDKAGGQQITIYEPQVESWKGNQLQERAAVAIQNKSSSEPTYGVIWLSARTEVDKANHIVTLEDVQITKGNFPAKPEMTETYLKLLRPNTPQLVKQVALDHLQANLAVTKAEEKPPAHEYKNEPPKIIYSQSPAILVLVDGQPVLRDGGAPDIMRVVNTRALLVLDKKTGKYYFYMGDRWMEASDIGGPWSASKNPPSTLSQVKKNAVDQKQADLLDSPDSGVIQELKQGTVPKVYVSTVPAELIQTAGNPELQPVSGTQLLYVNNTADSIFVNTADQDYYVLVSGRWYRSKSLNGPWNFVSAKKLPSDFAQIPEEHPKGTVLASVAGTPQAQEAGIANDIPQTATIDRQQASLTTTYDGAPTFNPIEGTPLQYAVNSEVPVIQVDPNSFYSVHNGVWFVGTSPSGPWVAATQVPAVIYSIPPSSPLYYVTYVRIYGSTPKVVYEGYTPGYLGSYTSADGVVVYGTGYVYPGWVGTVWYGPPVTYGYGWAWGPGFGWGFGFGVGVFAGVAFFPAWGPYRAWGPGWGAGWHGGPGWAHGWGGPAWNVNHSNLYGNWSHNVVRNTAMNGGNLNRGYGHGPNNVFAGRNGQVYRYDRGGWQTHTGQAWRSASRAGTRPDREIEQSRQARSLGQQRYNAFKSGAQRAPQISRRNMPQGGGRSFAGGGGSRH